MTTKQKNKQQAQLQSEVQKTYAALGLLDESKRKSLLDMGKLTVAKESEKDLPRIFLSGTTNRIDRRSNRA